MFSVIIPCFNRLEFLKETLASIWNQKFNDFEIIVVDDGSTDGTFDYLQEHRNRVRLLRQQNLGPGAARNFGAQNARGRYFAFLDSDDVWFPWSLETYAEAIFEYDWPAFLAGRPIQFRDKGELADVSSKPFDCLAFADYLSSASEWRWWGVSSFIVKAEAFRETSGFISEQINGEDADLALKLGIAKGFVQVISPATFGYRVHSGNLTSNFRKSVAGVCHKIRSERNKTYPGGKTRRAERHEILTRHVRPIALTCIRHGASSQGWKLYFDTFSWHISQRRFKFLVGFPILGFFHLLRGHLHSSKLTATCEY